MQEQMNVCIDQAGKQRDVSEVKDLCALGMVHTGAHGANPLALHQYLAGLKHRSAVNLQQPCGVQDDGCRCWLLCGDRGRGKNQATANKNRAQT